MKKPKTNLTDTTEMSAILEHSHSIIDDTLVVEVGLPEKKIVKPKTKQA